MQTKTQQQPYDAIILGAGASGLMCALTASKNKKSIALIDHNKFAGRKISISGGGKANFTNLHMNSDYFIADASFIEPALDAFLPRAMQNYLARHNLGWEEREHGQLFGLENAKRIVNALVDDCQRQGCHFYLEHQIDDVCKKKELFGVNCTYQGKKVQFFAKSLILALGSSAWENIGASDLGLKLAAKFGHSSKSFTPALTSLIMQKDWELAGLSGISLRVNIKSQGYIYNDDLLFTHSGISGPASLKASCHWQKNEPIHIDFMPHLCFAELLDAKECGKLFTQTLLSRHMPQRLAQKLLPQEVAKKKIAELSRMARNTISENIHNHAIIPQAKGALARAEAALGGVNTLEIDPWSMASKMTQDLYIIGELLDVTGQLGGYNLHFAFASGHLAGLNI